jgi:5-formyltetrahydrofolate cyclo-ligase
MIRDFFRFVGKNTRSLFKKKTPAEIIISEKMKIRDEVRAAKQKFSEELKSYQSDKILEAIESQPEFMNAKTILMYWSMSDEVATHDFIRKWSGEKTILLPVVKGHHMTLRPFTHKDELTKSEMGMMEPLSTQDYLKKVDLAIIPGMAFDRNKRRLGRGKGYYDRYFKNRNFSKWGICFDFQLYHNIPSASFDIRMDKIITPDEIIA